MDDQIYISEYVQRIKSGLNDSSKTYHPSKIKRMLNGTDEKNIGYPKRNLSDNVSKMLANRDYSLWFGDFERSTNESSVYFRNRKIAANLDLISFPLYKYDPIRKKNGISIMFEDDGSLYTYPYRNLSNLQAERISSCPFKTNDMDARCLRK